MSTGYRNFNTEWSVLGNYYGRPGVPQHLPGPIFLDYVKAEEPVGSVSCQKSILNTIQSDKNLKNIYEIIKKFNYTNKLNSGIYKYTFFAPENVNICDTANVDEIDFLQFHTLNYPLTPDRISKSIRVQSSMFEYKFDICRDDKGKIYIPTDKGNNYVLKVINCCNGILYIIKDPIQLTI